jgi:hypothetical protein
LSLAALRFVVAILVAATSIWEQALPGPPPNEAAVDDFAFGVVTILLHRYSLFGIHRLLRTVANLEWTRKPSEDISHQDDWTQNTFSSSRNARVVQKDNDQIQMKI